MITTTDPTANYSVGEVRTRIGVYIGIAALSAASSGLLNLAMMTDEQLAKITLLRWVLTVLILIVSIALAGLNAFRAAIDRSTSGGKDAATPPPSV